MPQFVLCFLFFFFNDTATTEIYTLSYTLSLHDALPISSSSLSSSSWPSEAPGTCLFLRSEEHTSELQSHSEISYAVFCLKKKKKKQTVVNTFPFFVWVQFQSLAREAILWQLVFFFFNDTATTEIYTLSYTLSLHDALPIYSSHIQKSRMPSSACDWS